MAMDPNVMGWDDVLEERSFPLPEGDGHPEHRQ